MPEALAAYERPGLCEAVEAALAAHAAAGRPVSIDELAALDAFHIMGREATHRLARLAGIARDEAVLDVGCGLAGPARVLAATYGCRVVGVDQSATYVALARLLNERTGLADRIEVHHADALALPFSPEAFTVVWCQHVTMNVADKRALFEAARRMVPVGGRLAMFEVTAGAGGRAMLPVPWAERAEESHLVSAERLQAAARAAGWRQRCWRDVSAAAHAWFRRRVSGPPATDLTVRLLLGEQADEKLRNVVCNLAERRIHVGYAVFEAVER